MILGMSKISDIEFNIFIRKIQINKYLDNPQNQNKS